ncbi:conjugative transposon protein TraJ [Segetibacter koreensis]|uniref:conjugative transposon protein TraJ n=1 Tax=Segetibacter koreensis TaxID=398037 RepID=UPI00035DBD57|nr:conjugative transposon protein TraJ [Segetibacter koreensis]
MTSSVKIIFWMITRLFLPILSNGQSQGATNLESLREVLDQLYVEMIPMCSKLIGVGRALAAFAALWYIASRVWKHLASSESIDFYPLFRPFVMGFAILIFPSVLTLINGIMQPTVTVTSGMVKSSDKAVEVLLQEKEKAIKSSDAWQMYIGETGQGDRARWYKYTHPEDINGAKEGVLAGIGNDLKFAMAATGYSLRNTIKEWISEVLEMVFQAAALCINTLRTFNLIVLSILGPLVFGLSVFDGFQYTFRHWLAKYINVFLWLPVANLFGAIIGKVEENMLKLDLSQVQNTGDTVFSRTDVGYLIFMIIGIVGYFTVPAIANYIMNVGSANAIGYKANSFINDASGMAGYTAGGVAGAAGNKMQKAVKNLWNGGKNSMGGNTGISGSSGAGASQYQYDKLSGK